MKLNHLHIKLTAAASRAAPTLQLQMQSLILNTKALTLFNAKFIMAKNEI